MGFRHGIENYILLRFLVLLVNVHVSFVAN